ncbi:MAG: hypothetical protein JW731_16270 [Bacteroidales bacterium]|nr:hypothetical protein [Bacteroidales bacterium]
MANIANNLDTTSGIEFPYRFIPETKNYPVVKKPFLKSDKEIMKDGEYQLWWSPFVDRNQVD